MRLNLVNLKNIKAANIELPKYDKEHAEEGKLASGITFIGAGNFPLGFFAGAYMHPLLQIDPALGCDITAISLQTDTRSKAFKDQGGYFTLVERQGSDEKIKIVSCVREVIFAPENCGYALEELCAVPVIAICTTENGYYMANGEFNVNHPDIQKDLESGEPSTMPAYIAHAIVMCMDRGGRAPVVMCLDNIQHNGEFTKKAVLGFLAAWCYDDMKLLTWAKENVVFVSTMVDRIVPKTSDELKTYVAQTTGMIDETPVTAESFKDFYIEEPKNGELPHFIRNLELVGAKIVPDVSIYEKMKLRLLNVSHLAVACLGDLAGYEFIDDTMANPLFKNMMATLMDKETGPTLPELPGVDLPVYKRQLIERFANTAIKDTTQRVATDAPLAVALDSIRDRLADNKDIDLLALTVAAWLQRVGTGKDMNGRTLDVRHPLKGMVAEKLNEGKGVDAMPMLGIEGLFGDLSKNDRFKEVVNFYFDSLKTQGVLNTLNFAIQAAQHPAPQGAKPDSYPVYRA